MQERDARALASASPEGDVDVVGIPRGRCYERTEAGEVCVCTGYVQRHTSMKVQLDGRCASSCTCTAHAPPPPPALPPPRLPAPDARLLRPVRNDNQPELLLCLRCGREAHRHLNLLHARDRQRNARDGQPPPPQQEQRERGQEGLGRGSLGTRGLRPVGLDDAGGTLV